MKFKEKVKKLKKQVTILYLVYLHKGVQWYKKAFLLLVIGYAVSPIDLIPDFIPVLGLLDDFILIPLGIILAIKMVPKAIWQECERDAANGITINKRIKSFGIALIITLWVIMIASILINIFK